MRLSIIDFGLLARVLPVKNKEEEKVKKSWIRSALG